MKVEILIGKEELKRLGIEYISQGKDGRKGYFRKIPRSRYNPSISQAEHRLKFSELSYDLFGVRGVQEIPDGTVISKHAIQLGKLLEGTGKPKKEPSLEEKLIKLILNS